MKISVITPSFNSGADLGRAIDSVLAQDYGDWEHIVVDGGSTDGSLGLLESHRHLRWISEPDRGQVDAIHKGLRMATGDVIVHLNADDHFLDGAFRAVADAFAADVDMVMGQVRVFSEDTGEWWLNDPCCDLESVLRHWEPQAFCVNPVGYFYRRPVAEAVPLNPANDDKHDLEFLMHAAARFRIRRIDRILGVFMNRQATKTARQQADPDYWRPANFAFADPLVARFPADWQRDYRAMQACCYQARRQGLINRQTGIARGKVVVLPPGTRKVRAEAVPEPRLAAEGDAVVCHLSPDPDAAPGNEIWRIIAALPPYLAAFPVYALNGLNGTMATFMAGEGRRLIWKIIVPIADPLTAARAMVSGAADAAALFERAGAYVDGLRRLFDRDLPDTGFPQPPDIDEAHDGVLSAGGGNKHLMVLRVAPIASGYKAAFRRFLGIPDLRLPQDPQPFAADCARQPLLPDNPGTRRRIDDLYAGLPYRHLFAATELAAMRDAWFDCGRPAEALASDAVRGC